MIYPIKSCGGIEAKELTCNILGPENGHVRDRVFMIITIEGQGITARSHPKIVLIQPRFEGDMMILSAPEQPEISIDVKKLHQQARGKSVVWGEQVSTVDCGDEVAAWVSRYLINDNVGFRLVFYPDSFSTRDAWGKKKNSKDLETHAGALHDVTSYMLMNEASIEDLNKRLKDPVTSRHFRPNFLVNGRKEYAEDEWEWVRIGNVIFKNIFLCGR
uniref:Uncharacterized protein n=1 Tax=Phlebotomus papatasi TaxID=29031 RepID=A0A1B0DML0_PHLPP